MKRLAILIGLALFLSAESTYAGTTHKTSASAATTGPAIPASVNTEFSQDFSRAKDVQWEIHDNFYKATFNWHGKVLYAFYTNDDLIGIATNIQSDKLPHDLLADIKKSYADYWITDLFKYRNESEDGYTITLENADQIVVLKSIGTQGWEIYKKSSPSL